MSSVAWWFGTRIGSVIGVASGFYTLFVGYYGMDPTSSEAREFAFTLTAFVAIALLVDLSRVFYKKYYKRLSDLKRNLSTEKANCDLLLSDNISLNERISDLESKTLSLAEDLSSKEIIIKNQAEMLDNKSFYLNSKLFDDAHHSINRYHYIIHYWQNEYLTALMARLDCLLTQDEYNGTILEVTKSFPCLREFVNCVSDVLHSLYGKNYAVCIKLVTPVEASLNNSVMAAGRDVRYKDLKTETLFRNKGSDARTAIDDTIRREGNEPSLDSNSDFKDILEENKPLKDSFYRENNLPNVKTNDYLNTSRDLYRRHPDIFKELGIEFDDNWPLPYKSTVIVPICPLDATENKRDLSGFLCADCNEINAFPDDLSIKVLRGAADALYSALSALAISEKTATFVEKEIE